MVVDFQNLRQLMMAQQCHACAVHVQDALCRPTCLLLQQRIVMAWQNMQI